MEESKFHLLKAYSYLESYIDVDLCDSFFEDTEETKNNNEKNEQLKIGVVGHLKKLFHTLIENIKKAINKMKNFFKGSYDNKKKKTIEDVKEAIKNNPELAKQVVVMPDFEEKNNLYNDAEKELDKEIQSDDNSNKSKEELKEIGNKIIEKFKNRVGEICEKSVERAKQAITKSGESVVKDIENCSKFAKHGVKVITLDTAIKLIDRNVEIARMVNGALNMELITLSDLEKITGSEKNAIKMRKQIAKYAKNGFFHRLKVSLLHGKSQDVQSVLDEQLKIVLDYTHLDENGHSKDSDGKIVSSKSLKNGVWKHPFFTRKLVKDQDIEKIKKDHQTAVDNIRAVDNAISAIENIPNNELNKIKNTKKEIDKGVKVAKEIGKSTVNTATKIGKMGKNIVADIPTHMKNKKTTIKMH